MIVGPPYSTRGYAFNVLRMFTAISNAFLRLRGISGDHAETFMRFRNQLLPSLVFEVLIVI